MSDIIHELYQYSPGKSIPKKLASAPVKESRGGREKTSEVWFAAGARLDHRRRSALWASTLPPRLRKSEDVTGAPGLH